jgi:amidase
VTRWLRDAGRGRSHQEVRAVFDRLVARVKEWFGETEVLLTPTTPFPAPRVGAWRDLPPDRAFHAAAPLGAFTAAWNMSGQPAASIPAGLTASGLPIGAQLVGRPGADETILALARQLETALGAFTTARRAA